MKTKVAEICAEALQEIKPTKQETERVLQEVKQFLNKVNSRLKKAKAVLGGSFAKGTWLSGDYDVDIFVRYEQKDEIGKRLGETLKPFNPEVLHGSRDYYQIKNSVHYELIPVLKIQKHSQAENVTDMSYFHVQYIKKQPQKIKDDIRLFKQFCKAQRVYGAESYIRGFSGHVVDLLVAYYKGFLPLLKAISKWKPKVVIDMKNHHKGKALLQLNKSKTQGPVVFVDPVQPDRNAAAAVGEESFNTLQEAAKAFLKKPSKKFFEKEEFNYEKLKKKGHLFIVEGHPVEGTTDVQGTKLLKVHEAIQRALEDYGIKQADWNFDTHEQKAEMHYVLEQKELPKEYEFQGPPLEMEEAAKQFKKANKKTYTGKGHIWAKKKRETTKARNAIQKALKENKHRIRRPKIK